MSKKILVVDDSVSMRQLLYLMLRDIDMEILFAEDGLDGFKKLSEDIALIISDYYMPGMNGLELVKKVRQGAINPSVPILILTTEEDNDLIEGARVAGATGWMNKQVRQEALLDTVRRCLITEDPCPEPPE